MKQTKVLPKNSFFSLMEAMRSYLSTHPDCQWSLPYDIFVDKTSEENPDAEDPHHIDITNCFMLQSKNDFETEMNEARRKAKQFATERINDYFDQMIEIGKENPMSRHAIVELFSFER
ncbi:MAG: hypothetical protein WGN25_03160 [Candidatus Electrothrix sp. GW3-4]|uniref:hypothetical protein n=1 Tax=Candidatus Electrothrix sp. GW3-4 TaxID=3126740 RepID=UPI0030D210F4